MSANSDRIFPPISVVIPAFDEEASVAAQVEVIRSVLTARNIVHEIIVVDDGSTDHTAEEAAEAKARVLQHSENRGYGASIKDGIMASKYDTIVIIDADSTYPAEEIPILVTELANADMVVGARVGQEVDIYWLRQPAKWFLRLLATHIASQRIPDLNSGLRTFRRSCIQQYFPILSNRFSFTTTLTLAYLADEYRVVYHPINYYARVGKSKIVPWHFMDFMALIIRMSMMFNPLRVFVPVSLGFGLLGMLKVTYDLVALFIRYPNRGWSVLLEPTLSTSSVLLLFVSLQLMVLGMVADGIIRRLGLYKGTVAPYSAVSAVELENDQQEIEDLTKELEVIER